MGSGKNSFLNKTGMLAGLKKKQNSSSSINARGGSKRELGAKTAMGMNRFRMTPIVQSTTKTPVQEQEFLIVPNDSKTPGLSSKAIANNHALMLTSATSAFKDSTVGGSSIGRLDKSKKVRSNVVSPAKTKEPGSGNAVGDP